MTRVTTSILPPLSAPVGLEAPRRPRPSADGASDADLLHGAARLWRGPTSPGLQVRMFRRTVHLAAAPSAVELRLTAASYFHLWINGQYVSRGPTFHPPGPLPVARLEVTDHFRVGRNVIAVLVYCPGFPTHQVPTIEPGLWAALRVRDGRGHDTWTLTDERWAVCEQTGWRAHAVRHGYALGPVEVLDAAAHPWGWEQPDFDDHHWAAAETLSDDGEPVEVDLPTMRFGWAAAEQMVGQWRVGSEPAPLRRGQACEVLGEWLRDEPWQHVPSGEESATWDADAGRLHVNGLTKDHGHAVVLDFGQERVGNLAFDVESQGAGTLEIGWSEVCHDGRPAVSHKGTTYVDRLLARAGRQRWEALQFSGLRYIVLIIRGFEGAVTFENIGVRTSTGAPQLRADFACSDPRLEAVWGLCRNTLEIGTQETIIDCPSREQAPYLGDGHLVGRWLGAFSEDYRHWRYLIDLGFSSQAEDGLLRDAPLMPVQRSLIDYVLLTVIGVRDYLRETGDRALAEKHLDGCRRALRYFDQRVDASGMLRPSEVEGIRLEVAWDIAGPPRPTERLDPHLFIDHPGLGGHNAGDVGLERRGRNGALNALYVLACEAMADLEMAVGEPSLSVTRRAEAQRTRIAAAAFWDPHRSLYVDAIDGDGQRYGQISEQTNILAALAGFVPESALRSLLQHVLKPDAAVARCGPYFFAYLLPLMGRVGMHREALDLIGQRWGKMLESGATSLWETFAGDSQDTWCHPWSAAPASFLMHDILGIQPGHGTSQKIDLRPRYDLLDACRGLLPYRQGSIALAWRTVGTHVELEGELPAGSAALLHPVGGGTAVNVQGHWHHTYSLPQG